MDQMQSYWELALKYLQEDMAEVAFSTWMLPLVPVAMENNDFTFKIKGTPQEQVMCISMLKMRYIPALQNALRLASNREFNVRFLTEGDELPKKQSLEDGKQSEIDAIANLNPRYVFSTFVVGNSNRMAHAASLAVAEAPAKAYNPLFLYGNAGLGKTHLMHSIAHYILEKNPAMKVLYTSSETFTNELINSIRYHTNEEFRNKYRNIDVLLVDDIQFIADKKETQEEFFHTFNAIHESNKQIIISSDRPPKEIKTLEERLRSRFEWGLIADIQPPDYETRIAILRKKAEMEGHIVPNDVMSFIAKSIVSNIRELEGALTRIVAYATLTNQEITIQLAEDALKDIFSEKATVQITPELIQNIVGNYYNISPEEICGSKKPKSIAYPRQIAMYLSRKILDISLPKIGERFGGRDHTTVIHACSKIEKELENNTELQKIIFELEKQIKGQ